MPNITVMRCRNALHETISTPHFRNSRGVCCRVIELRRSVQGVWYLTQIAKGLVPRGGTCFAYIEGCNTFCTCRVYWIFVWKSFRERVQWSLSDRHVVRTGECGEINKKTTKALATSGRKQALARGELALYKTQLDFYVRSVASPAKGVGSNFREEKVEARVCTRRGEGALMFGMP